MLKHVKRMVAFMLAIMAVTVAASSVASAAPQYKVSGKVFTGTETISASLLLLSFSGVLKKESFLLSTLPGGAKIVLSCTAVGANGGKIFKNKEDSAESILFTGCKVVEPVTCKLGNSSGVLTTSITTAAVTSVIEEVGGLLWVKFTPKSGSTFVIITLLECAGEGTFTISGTARALILTNAEEALKGINFNATSGSNLKFGTQAASILGLIGLTLSGTNKGLVWGVN